jgi:ribonuclease P protein component
VFLELLRGRRKVVGPLELAIRERPDPREAANGPNLSGSRAASGGARVGIVVGRKNLSRAVDRNALKRIVREAFRSQRAQLPSRDLLFRLRQRLTGIPREIWKVDVIKAVNELIVLATQALPTTKPVRTGAHKSPQKTASTAAGSEQ